MLLLAEEDAARSQPSTLLSLSRKAFWNSIFHANTVQEDCRKKANFPSGSLDIPCSSGLTGRWLPLWLSHARDELYKCLMWETKARLMRAFRNEEFTSFAPAHELPCWMSKARLRGRDRVARKPVTTPWLLPGLFIERLNLALPPGQFCRGEITSRLRRQVFDGEYRSAMRQLSWKWGWWFWAGERFCRGPQVEWVVLGQWNSRRWLACLARPWGFCFPSGEQSPGVGSIPLPGIRAGLLLAPPWDVLASHPARCSRLCASVSPSAAWVQAMQGVVDAGAQLSKDHPRGMMSAPTCPKTDSETQEKT